MALTIDDFQRISDRIPLLADMKPSGSYVQEDLDRVGGIPALMKYLLDEGLLHGDCLTVTGNTLAENLADAPPLANGQKIIHPLNQPVHKSGHIRILRGNLAPEGAVGKITGKEGLSFTGPAIVFDSEEQMLAALEDHQIKKGDVIIIRYEGPQGGPGMPEMLAPISAIMGAGLGADVALMTDGRFSGGSRPRARGTAQGSVDHPLTGQGDHALLDRRVAVAAEGQGVDGRELGFERRLPHPGPAHARAHGLLADPPGTPGRVAGPGDAGRPKRAGPFVVGADARTGG